MSIIPVNDQRGIISNPSSLDLWDPEEIFNLDLWEAFPLPSSMLFSHFPSFFPSLGTQVSSRETPRSYVYRAVFPGFNREDVLVYIDDENMLQISTGDGKFVSKFKLPENAVRDQVKASMMNGVLTVTIPKVGSQRPNVRTIAITGSG